MENYGPWEGNLVKAQKQVLLCGSIQISKWGRRSQSGIQYRVFWSFQYTGVQLSLKTARPIKLQTTRRDEIEPKIAIPLYENVLFLK